MRKPKETSDGWFIIFTEDECDPTAESLDAAWFRIFGTDRKSEAKAGPEQDNGDNFVQEYKSGRRARIGPPSCGWTNIEVKELPSGY